MNIQIEKHTGLRFGVTVRVRSHELIADLAAADGGEDAGPTPHDLYDAALGACKAMTVLLYAKRKEIPVEGITVLVERDASLESNGSYRLDARLEIKGDIAPDQLRMLESVAHRCPIHRLMTTIATSIATRVERAT